MAMVASALRRMWGRTTERRVLALGLDASGRTTIVYRLKLQETVTTIPTIGFNVETIELQGLNLTIWDVGGCDKIRPLWRHYYQNTSALVFVIDSNDRDRIDEALNELSIILREDELRDALLLVWANKRDLPNAIPMEELREKIAREASGRRWHLQPCVATAGEGLDEGIEWLRSSMLSISNNSHSGDNSDESSSSSLKSSSPATRLSRWLSSFSASSSSSSSTMPSKPPLEALHKIITDGEDSPLSSVEFLDDFERGIVARFDHRCHLRVGFLVLFQSACRGEDHRTATKHFISLLRTFFDRSDPKQIRRTFHITMTMFWCYILQLHLVEYLKQAHSIATFMKSHPDETSLATNDEFLKMNFMEFMRSAPLLSWSGLWSEFYSKDVMMSPKAKEEFVLPDRRPLPLILGQSSVPSNAMKSSIAVTRNCQLSDRAFLERFDERLLHEFDETSLLRVCYLALLRGKREGVRRGIVVSELMKTLQPLLMAIRARNAAKEQEEHRMASNSNNLLCFSETQVYFYIQLCDAAIAAVDVSHSHSASTANKPSLSISSLSFTSFLNLFPELNPQQSPWKPYYSRHLFYDDVAARRQFVPPNLGIPLPNVFPKRRVSLPDTGTVSTVDHDRGDPKPSPTALQLLSKRCIDALLSPAAPTPSSPLDSATSSLSPAELTASLEAGAISPSLSHLDFMRIIVAYLSPIMSAGKRDAIAVSKIAEVLEALWKHSTPLDTAVAPSPTPSPVESPSPIPLPSSVCSISNAQGPPPTDVSKNLDHHAVSLYIAACSPVLHSHPGLSFLYFYVQMVAAALTELLQQRSTTPLEGEAISEISFAELVSAHPELLWNRLHALFYSDDVMFSPEGRALIMPPDRQQIPAFLSSAKYK